MTRLENSHETSFYKWCRSRGLLCLKLVAVGRRGFPDRAILLPGGVIVLLEFKRKDGKVSEHQKVMLAKLSKMGFRAEVVYTRDEAIAIIEEYL